MSALAATTAFTLGDLKKCVIQLMANLAALTEPDTYGCTGCAKTVEDRCPDHAGDATASMRLIRAAEQVRVAETRGDVEAAIVYAAGDGGI